MREPDSTTRGVSGCLQTERLLNLRSIHQDYRGEEDKDETEGYKEKRETNDEVLFHKRMQDEI